MKDIRKEIQEELENLAPSLSKMEKKGDFEIPENYFNELPDKILNQLDFPKNSVAVEASWVDILMKKIAVFFQPKVAMGFTMATLLMFSIYFLTKNTTSAPLNFAELSLDEMETYLEENIEDFDEEVLFNLVAENGIDNLGNLDVNEEDLDDYMNEIIEDIEDNDLEDLL